MNVFINILLYSSTSFLVIMLLWAFKTFIDTRRRYRMTRILKGSDKDLEEIKQQMKTANRGIVLEGDASEKSILLLRKAFDKITQGIIFRNKNNENIKTIDNLDNKAQQ